MFAYAFPSWYIRNLTSRMNTLAQGISRSMSRSELPPPCVDTIRCLYESLYRVPRFKPPPSSKESIYFLEVPRMLCLNLIETMDIMIIQIVITCYQFKITSKRQMIVIIFQFQSIIITFHHHLIWRILVVTNIPLNH